MIFKVGQIYWNTKTGRHVSVLKVLSEKPCLRLRIAEVDPVTLQHLFHNEIAVEPTEVVDWETVEWI